MVKWGLNKNQKSKESTSEFNTSEVDSTLIENVNPHLIEEDKVHIDIELNENKRELEGYNKKLDGLDSKSKKEKISIDLNLGLPTSLVVGYFDANKEEDLIHGEDLYRERIYNTMVDKRILSNQIKEKVLIVTVDDGIVSDLIELVGDREYIVVKDIDLLIIEMEKEVKELTVIFDKEIPTDIYQSMSLLVDHLESVDGIYFVEIGSEKFFSNSMVLKDLSSLKDSRDENDVENKELIDTAESGVVPDIVPEVTKQDHLFDENEKLKSILKDTEFELEKHKDMYEEILTDIDKREMSINKLIEEIEEKGIEINSLKEQIDSNTMTDNNKLIKEDKELLNKYNLLLSNYSRLEEDLKQMRFEYAEKELIIEAQKELIRDRNKEISKLKENLDTENLNHEDIIIKMQDEIDSKVDYESYNDVEKKLNDSLIEAESLKEQVMYLRVSAQKETEEKVFLKEDLETLNISYKELLNVGSNTTKVLKDILISDEIKSQFFYFKVINQPPYFRSFMGGMKTLLKKNGRTLTIILRDSDDLSELYLKGMKKVNVLEELSSEDETVWLTPSNIMFDDISKISVGYDYIIIIDYLKSKERYLKGGNLIPIHVFIDESERDLLGVKGMVLCGGENSIVDLRYDKKFESARTPYIRKLYIEKKVLSWLHTFGIK